LEKVESILIRSLLVNWRLGYFLNLILKGLLHKISKKPLDARINSKESILPAYVARRAVTTTMDLEKGDRFSGINSVELMPGVLKV
jgi:hypothetical protein